MIILSMDELIGTKVTHRSNKCEPLLHGILTGSLDNGMPIIKDNEGNEYMCGGIVFPYNSELVAMLEKMTPKDQYELMANIRNCFSLLEMNGLWRN